MQFFPFASPKTASAVPFSTAENSLFSAPGAAGVSANRRYADFTSILRSSIEEARDDLPGKSAEFAGSEKRISGMLSSNSQHVDFDAVVSSFIEDGRTDYAGRPAGFAKYERDTGTLNEQQTTQIIKALRQRKVDETLVQGLEQVLASGAPMTVSGIFSFLSGESRLTPPLEGEERDAFKMLLGKLALGKDDVDQMLALSDDGDMKGFWTQFTGKLDQLEGPVDVTKKEFSSLLSALDLSDATRKNLQTLFDEGASPASPDARTLGGRELAGMIKPANTEHLLREEAVKHTLTQMRDAVTEGLKAARIKETSLPVADLRGDRRSEQTEAFMQASVLQKIGVADIKRDGIDRNSPQQEPAGRETAAIRDDSSEKTPRGTSQLANTDGADDAPRVLRATEMPAERSEDLIARLLGKQGDGRNRQPVTRQQAARQETLQTVHPEQPLRENALLFAALSGTEKGESSTRSERPAQSARSGRSEGPGRADSPRAAADSRLTAPLERMAQNIVQGAGPAEARPVQTGQTASPAAQPQDVKSLADNARREIVSRLENSIAQSAPQGDGRLVLPLSPEALGTLSVLLSTRQGDLTASIRTENQETATLVREELVSLKSALEARGIRVQELNVETQLRDQSSTEQGTGQEQGKNTQERDPFVRLGQSGQPVRTRQGKNPAREQDVFSTKRYGTEEAGSADAPKNAAVLSQPQASKAAGEGSAFFRQRHDDPEFADDDTARTRQNGVTKSAPTTAVTAAAPATELASVKKTDANADKAVETLSRLLVPGEASAGQAKAAAPGNQAHTMNRLAGNFRQEIFSQVEKGILQSAQNGGSSLVLQLAPEDLGTLTVMLTMRQGELTASIKTENQDTTTVIREQLVELKATLEAQGIKVKELDVETQLNDNASSEQWNGTQEHNLMRDSHERGRLIRLARMQRGAGIGAADHKAAAVPAAQHNDVTGLHIVA